MDLKTSKRKLFLWPAIGFSLLALAILAYAFSMGSLVLLFVTAVAGVLFARTFQAQETTAGSIYAAEAKVAEKESKAEIFALGKLFEATMSGMREGLVIVDEDMRVVASNPAAHRLFSSSQKNLNTQRLTELTRNPAIYGAFLDALKGEERTGVKVETYDSSRRVFDLRVVPLGSDKSRPEGAIGVFFDITRLEKLERVRQEFLSNVSHELRTPLTAILAFVETLESGRADDPESMSRFLAIIRKNASRMHTLIDDILELSAIEAGNVNVEARSIPLAPIVNDVIASLGNHARERNISIVNQVTPQTIVLADPRRLEQMLTNLIENAIKFNRESGSITIKCETDQQTRILVEDTGEGISAHHLERLFERFYRVDRARSREMGGTGLGLAIVKHLARAHGGDVSVESKVNEGSVFGIELPRAVTSEHAA